MSTAYTMRDAYMANAMGNGAYLEHANWKNHKYINKIFKNGKWLYDYGKGFVDKKITGASAKERMERGYASAQKWHNEGRLGAAHNARETAGRNRAEYNKSLFGAVSNARRSLNHTINSLKRDAAGSISKGKSFLSDMKSKLTTTLSNARTMAATRINSAKDWIDRNITGASAKARMERNNELIQTHTKAGNRTAVNLAKKYRDEALADYNKSLAGKLSGAGRKASNTASTAYDSVSSAANKAYRNVTAGSRNKSYAQAARSEQDARFREEQQMREYKRRKQVNGRKKTGGSGSSSNARRYGAAAY